MEQQQTPVLFLFLNSQMYSMMSFNHEICIVHSANILCYTETSHFRIARSISTLTFTFDLRKMQTKYDIDFVHADGELKFELNTEFP